MIAGSAGLALTLAAILLPGRVVLQARSPQSVPFTVGIQVAAPPRWHAGDLVAFRTRDLRPYYPPGTPFTKTVVGTPGNHITRLGRDFYVNGRYVGTARATDSEGHPTPLFTPPLRTIPKCDRPPVPLSSCRVATASVIPAEHLFVLGTHERSFDSRYWGFVTSTEVLGRVVALL